MRLPPGLVLACLLSVPVGLVTGHLLAILERRTVNAAPPPVPAKDLTYTNDPSKLFFEDTKHPELVYEPTIHKINERDSVDLIFVQNKDVLKWLKPAFFSARNLDNQEHTNQMWGMDFYHPTNIEIVFYVEPTLVSSSNGCWVFRFK